MVNLDPTILSAIVALPVSLVSLAIVRASRAARRNREERCGQCGGPLYAPGALAGPSLLQGHLICEPCAAKERRGVSRSLLLAGSITAVAVLSLAAVALWAPFELGSHPWLPVIATLVTYPAIFGGAVAWMKRANRRAALRLGVPPDAALGTANHSAPALNSGIGKTRDRSVY